MKAATLGPEQPMTEAQGGGKDVRGQTKVTERIR